MNPLLAPLPFYLMRRGCEGSPSGTKTTDGLRRNARPDPGSCDAPSAGELDSSSFDSASSTPEGSESAQARRGRERDYVRAVLEYYLSLPGSATATSRVDRKCARELFRRGLCLELVKNAMMLAIVRRTYRAGVALPRIRALHYFLPVVEELEQSPLDPGYVLYLERKLRPLLAAKENENAISSSGADRRESVAENTHEQMARPQVAASPAFSHEPERYPEAPSRASSHRQSRDRGEDEAALRKRPP